MPLQMGTATTPKPAAAVQDRCHVVHALGGGALRLGATGVLAYRRLSIFRRPLDQPQGASRYCFALFGRVALAVSLKFNPPSPTLPFLVA